MNPKAVNVIYQKPYKLLITFDDHDQRIFNLKPYLEFPVYQPLKDESFCSNVKMENGIVFWNDEIDMDPDRLYLESTPVNNFIFS